MKKAKAAAAPTAAQPFDIYQMVTDKILKQIEDNGKLSWVKPWSVLNGGSFPMNGKTKRRYEGINFFLLQMSGYTSPYWLSFKQITDMGGSIRKGEKCTQVVFWKMNVYSEIKEDTQEEKTKKIPMLRYYNVWNAEQCDGLKLENPEAIPYEPKQRIELSETVIDQYGKLQPSLTMIIKESSQAFYAPGRDLINMPTIDQFKTPEQYYATFFHEMGHSTGHESRLNRKEIMGTASFGSCDYGYEELTAELTSAFICAEIGISNETLDNQSAAYIKNWMNAIKSDKKLFILAAARANKAAKLILNKPEPEYEEA